MPPKYTYKDTINYKQNALDWLKHPQVKRDIEQWVKARPSVDKTYDDLYKAIELDSVRFHGYPTAHEWDQNKRKVFGDKSGDVGGYYASSSPHGGDIHFPAGDLFSITDQTRLGTTLPHEIGHYFAGHKTGDRNVPEGLEYPWYTWLDEKFSGKLPNISAEQYTPESYEYAQSHNEYYPHHKEYHPAFDEYSFDSWGNFHPDSTSYNWNKYTQIPVKKKSLWQRFTGK